MAGRKRKPRVVIDGIEYLPSRLIGAYRFAGRLGLKGGAFHQILTEGLFPNPAPGLLASSGIYFCRPEMAPAWWNWLRNGATDSEIERIAQIVRESDARRIDYREVRDGVTPREWLIDVLPSYAPDKCYKYL